MGTPLVSVITPVYNGEKHLKESLESICLQTFRDFQLIILNDGSVDNTERVVLGCLRKDSYKYSVTYISCPNNKKIPTRRNECIIRARGKYIVIHDGDDISLPNRLEKQVEFMESNQDVFCVGGHAKKIDLEGQHIGEMNYPPLKHDDIVAMIKQKNMNPMIDPTTMFKRKDFLTLGGYTLEKAIYTVPDFDLWLRAIQSEKIFANLDESLIKYRTNPNGMTGKHKQEMIHAHMVTWLRFMSKQLKRPLGSVEKYHYDCIRKLQENCI